MQKVINSVQGALINQRDGAVMRCIANFKFLFLSWEQFMSKCFLLFLHDQAHATSRRYRYMGRMHRCTMAWCCAAARCVSIFL